MNKAQHTPRPPRFWVYEKDILRAAQGTYESALQYWKPGREILTAPKNKEPDYV